MSDVLKRVLCLALALVVVFSFSACRHSPVLEQQIYTQDGEIDPDNQQTDNDEEHTQEDTTLPPRTTQSTAPHQDDQTRVSAKPKPTTPSPQLRSRTGNQTQATSNAQPSSTENSNKAQGNTPGVNPDPNSPIPAVDDRANFDPNKIPENLATVAAPGIAGIYVEMLGGSNRLLATSAGLKGNPLAGTVFADLSAVKGLWSNDGVDPMTEAQFQQLLSTNPEVVFYVFESTLESFTESQLQTLISRKIYTIPLHPFNTTKNIAENVNTIATVLGKRSDIQGAKDAKEIAKQYLNWLDEVNKGFGHTFSGLEKWNFDQEEAFQEGMGKNDSYADSGQYTLLIDGWDSGMAVANEAGGAYFKTGYSLRRSPVSYYLSLGGAANNAVRVPDVSGGYPYFPAVPTANEYNNSTIRGSYVGARQGRDVSRKVTAGLGTAGEFDKIIVDSNATWQSIANSSAWEPGTFLPTGEGRNAYVNSRGIDTQIVGPYEIIVNPSGVGSWIDGSPESLLEAYWANEVFNGNVPYDQAFQNISSVVSDFYKTFYQYELTANDLDLIRQGR